MHYRYFVEKIRTHKFAIKENSISPAIRHLLFIHCPSHTHGRMYTARFQQNAACAIYSKQQANAFLMQEYSIWNNLFWHMLSQRLMITKSVIVVITLPPTAKTTSLFIAPQHLIPPHFSLRLLVDMKHWHKIFHHFDPRSQFKQLT